jgi:HSP20 family protein
MTSSRYLSAFPSTLSNFPSGRELGEPLLDFHRELNRMFDDVVRNSFWPLTAAQQAAQQAVQQATMALTSSPRVNLEESDEELRVTAELPGVQQSDVEVKVEGDTLIISGEKKISSEQKQKNFHLMERTYGRFQRSVTLPFTPNPERAEATYDNGVLTVRLAKEEQQCSRRIEVQQGRSETESGDRSSAQLTMSVSDRDRERTYETQGDQASGSGTSSRQTGTGGTSGQSSSGQSGQKSSTERKQPQPA